MENFNFGENLKQIREAKEMKQLALADEMNISQSTLSRIEAEPYVPHDHLVEAAAKALNISPMELLPPQWFIKTVKRNAYALNRPGHAGYVILLICQCGAIIADVVNAPHRSTLEQVLLVSALVLVTCLFYYFTVTKVQITKY